MLSKASTESLLSCNLSGHLRTLSKEMHPTSRSMSFLVFLAFFVYATSSAIFSSVSCSPDVVQVCCYSTSPADYSPNCYPCPSNVYVNTLMACLNATEMPRNITFKQADCMEKNCKINFPTPSTDVGLARYADLANLISQFFGRGVEQQHKRKRSVDGGNVVQKVETLATGMGIGNVQFADPEYM